MTDIPTYITQFSIVSAEETRVVRCRNCQHAYGHLRLLDQLELLDTGGALARVYHGFCNACGADVHFTVSDRLIVRRLNGV